MKSNAGVGGIPEHRSSSLWKKNLPMDKPVRHTSDNDLTKKKQQNGEN